jgi:signal peptidase I
MAVYFKGDILTRDRRSSESRLLNHRKIWILVFAIGLAALIFLIPIADDSSQTEEPRSKILSVVGDAMAPTLLDGQMVTVGESQELMRFDVVLYRPPQAEERSFLGRIVGLPGEAISVDGGHILIDGEPIDDPIPEQIGYYLEEARIPSDSYFILGDNRNASYDSHHFGPVPSENVLGLVDTRWGPRLPAREAFAGAQVDGSTGMQYLRAP